MANHKSALKRSRQSLIRRMRNRTSMTRVKSVVKDVRLAVAEKPAETVAEKLNLAKSVIDKATKKGVVHKRTASRKISRLSKLANTLAA
ncbi:MAG: 30S ribosomal protein S20 [Desulfobacteraceae bacterium IS3]|nr:MAG: 30S ribosomal protein S20 [Desulfobacteraceae bacterium IS3]